MTGLTGQDRRYTLEVELLLENKLEVNAVMFDLDGTLIDTVPIYYEIIDIVFSELGVPVVTREILLEAMGNGEFDWECVLPENMRDRQMEMAAKARKIIDEIAPQMFYRQTRLIPGVAETFEKITAIGARIGLVTSTPARQMPVKMIPLSEAGLADLIEVVVTADDVLRKKPAAEPLVQCSEKLGVPFERCVYVGDTRVDIRAGRAAGMKTVGVLTGFDSYDTLKREMPDVLIESIADLHKALIFAGPIVDPAAA